MKVCPADVTGREACKIASEMLRPMNQGLETIGSAMPFAEYIDGTYRPTVLPLLATTTKTNYEGTLRKYLMPVFGKVRMRDMSVLSLQAYFSKLAMSDTGSASVLKIKEVLSSVLGSAVRYELLTKNSLLAVQIPRSKIVNKTKPKPHLTPEDFNQVIQLVAEPYATMIFVAVFTGLRPSELIALRWEDVHDESLTVDERYCRGDWSITKTIASSATIGVPSCVIARIRQLRTLEIEINWGGKGAKRIIKAVRKDGPRDLVFQSLRTGVPMRDGNILRRHLKPAAMKLGIEPKNLTWRSLRTTCATWLVESGANPKDVQEQMRHSRIATTMDVYCQYVPESQRRAVARVVDMVESRRPESGAVN